MNAHHEIVRADDPKTLKLTLEALRNVLDAFVVVWTLDERPRRVNPFPLDRLRQLAKGAELPEDDSQTKPRDTQFELMTGANLILGGADIVPQDPPDYTLLYHGRRVGVEAKRLTSLNSERVGARLSEAAKAILKTTGEGFVALNLDGLIEDLSGESPEEVGGKFNHQLREAHEQIQESSERKALLGALIFGTWNEWRFGNGRPELRWQRPVQLIGFGDEGSLERAQFFEYFESFHGRWKASMGELGRLLDTRA
jgi:hypothetical protein